MPELHSYSSACLLACLIMAKVITLVNPYFINFKNIMPKDSRTVNIFFTTL